MDGSRWFRLAVVAAFLSLVVWWWSDKQTRDAAAAPARAAEGERRRSEEARRLDEVKTKVETAGADYQKKVDAVDPEKTDPPADP